MLDYLHQALNLTLKAWQSSNCSESFLGTASLLEHWASRFGSLPGSPIAWDIGRADTALSQVPHLAFSSLLSFNLPFFWPGRAETTLSLSFPSLRTRRVETTLFLSGMEVDDYKSPFLYNLLASAVNHRPPTNRNACWPSLA